MNCINCGHGMRTHYQWFCPKCDIDILTVKHSKIGDLFKIMYHMETNGYMSKDKFWAEWFMVNFNFSNDTYVKMILEDTYDNEEINIYIRKVAKLLGVSIGDEVLMWISW